MFSLVRAVERVRTLFVSKFHRTSWNREVKGSFSKSASHPFRFSTIAENCSWLPVSLDIAAVQMTWYSWPRLVRHDGHVRCWLEATCHWTMTSVSHRPPEEQMPSKLPIVKYCAKQSCRPRAASVSGLAEIAWKIATNVSDQQTRNSSAQVTNPRALPSTEFQAWRESDPRSTVWSQKISKDMQKSPEIVLDISKRESILVWPWAARV